MHLSEVDGLLQQIEREHGGLEQRGVRETA